MDKVLAPIIKAVQTVIAILAGIFTKLPRVSSYPPQTQQKVFSAEVVRPDDLLIVTLDFYNLKLNSDGGGTRIEKVGPGNGFIVARFEPQSFAEQAFFETAPGSPKDTSIPGQSDYLEHPPVAARIAGPSQLVFRISDAQLPIDFKLDWEYDGSLWAQVADTGPEPRSGHGMVFDGKTTILFGGSMGAHSYGSTWSWDGKFWTQRQDMGPGPSLGAWHGL